MAASNCALFDRVGKRTRPHGSQGAIKDIIRRSMYNEGKLVSMFLSGTRAVPFGGSRITLDGFSTAGLVHIGVALSQS